MPALDRRRKHRQQVGHGGKRCTKSRQEAHYLRDFAGPEQFFLVDNQVLATHQRQQPKNEDRQHNSLASAHAHLHRADVRMASEFLRKSYSVSFAV
jgi:hypothetical protein